MFCFWFGIWTFGHESPGRRGWSATVFHVIRGRVGVWAGCIHEMRGASLRGLPNVLPFACGCWVAAGRHITYTTFFSAAGADVWPSVCICLACGETPFREAKVYFGERRGPLSVTHESIDEEFLFG